MTIEQAENDLIETFNGLGDWLSQYGFLLELAGDTPVPLQSEKNEQTKLRGCQSNAWLVTKTRGGMLDIAVDSDALLVRGILSIYVLLFQGRTLSEISESRLTFLDRTPLKEQLSTDRFVAIRHVEEKIRDFCVANQE